MSVKICVYAICKDESKFVESWLDSMSEADSIVVLDTGSTDGTYEKLKADPRVTKVEQKKIVPWRFDVARNESLKLVPEDVDVLVCTDFDETFNKGWADILRSKWIPGETTCAQYEYINSFTPQGEPLVVFTYNKICSSGCFWKYPAHEVVCLAKDTPETTLDLTKEVVLSHHQDLSKGRSYYFDLVKLGAEENPQDAHALILYARELFFARRFDESLSVFENILALPGIDDPGWFFQKYYSLSMSASIYADRQREDKVKECFDRMVACNPTYFEPYLFLGESYIRQDRYQEANDIVIEALGKCYRHYNWFEVPYTFLGWPQEILAVAKCKLGQLDEALSLIQEPLKHIPDNPRLLKKENTILKMKLKELIAERNPVEP